ncbi:8863_t:CDS:2, partial [Gigaspora rosea]
MSAKLPEIRLKRDKQPRKNEKNNQRERGEQPERTRRTTKHLETTTQRAPLDTFVMAKTTQHLRKWRKPPNAF